MLRQRCATVRFVHVHECRQVNAGSHVHDYHIWLVPLMHQLRISWTVVAWNWCQDSKVHRAICVAAIRDRCQRRMHLQTLSSLCTWVWCNRFCARPLEPVSLVPKGTAVASPLAACNVNGGGSTWKLTCVVLLIPLITLGDRGVGMYVAVWPQPSELLTTLCWQRLFGQFLRVLIAVGASRHIYRLAVMLFITS